MTTVDLPTSITTCSAASDYQLAKTAPGDTLIVHGPLTRDTPLVAVGRTIRNANPFDGAQFVPVACARGLQDDMPIVELRAAQGADGTWYGGQVLGLLVRGGNQDKANGDYLDITQHGIFVDYARPHADLNAATLCDVAECWTDGYYGPGTTLACSLKRNGRHGRTLQWDGCQLLLSAVDDNVRHCFAMETRHRLHGIEIDGCTFGGLAGYVSAPVGLGTYEYGLKYTRNHSTAADIAAGTIKTLAQWAFAYRMIFSGVMSYGVQVDGNNFEDVNPHIRENLPTPGVELRNVTSGSVQNNTIPCLGPFAKLTNCINVTTANNGGGPQMTEQT